MRLIWRQMGGLILAGSLVLGMSLAACAEGTESKATEPAGYHVYEVKEGYASDTWNGISRGAYLQAGMCSLSQGDKGYAECVGYTFAHFACDEVAVRIYLDESETATYGSWGTLNYWTGREYNDSMARVASGPYKITSGLYYRTTGGHTVHQGGDCEETTTSTDALIIY